MATERTLVFVYGTLKRGASNHTVMAGQQFVGEARTPPGHRLFVVADYPGLVRDPTDTRGVQGEVWSVDADALRTLDRFEGVEEKLYRRGPIPLLPPFDTASVDGYFYLRTVRGRRPLVDGVWPVRVVPVG
ncbi:gamma-glutamylcyclotransferase family protein [Synoicihabitans lomoniglobus]|uniref:Gamma-glutamylcyclotransferase family protein n=1 Tax=Synoicihabitans lomoniglobus TaxID=2909285 RepID=A0AAF0CQ13_9BACT|nr:gamma-glutamylcyclotransferase [Opitutaceae bacterium LMO-M01]WED65932.1 gamma-glutamylcyclotransferase [Opitutaceae bacterium LMO-M01]